MHFLRKLIRRCALLHTLLDGLISYLLSTVFASFTLLVMQTEEREKKEAHTEVKEVKHREHKTHKHRRKHRVSTLDKRFVYVPFTCMHGHARQEVTSNPKAQGSITIQRNSRSSEKLNSTSYFQKEKNQKCFVINCLKCQMSKRFHQSHHILGPMR